MSIRSKLTIAAFGVALLTSSAVALGESAAAASTCSSILQEQDQPGLNAFRAGARCSRIDANRKVRAWLVRDGGPDYYSQYFTRTNTYYYSGWYTCYLGCHDSYQVVPL